MVQIIIAISAMAFNLVVLFYVVRQATRANEQVALLRDILKGVSPVGDSGPVKVAGGAEKRAAFEREWVRRRLHLMYGPDSDQKSDAWRKWLSNGGSLD
jgi:hypothetical protein